MRLAATCKVKRKAGSNYSRKPFSELSSSLALSDMRELSAPASCGPPVSFFYFMTFRRIYRLFLIFIVLGALLPGKGLGD
jgi:hypothetical protein